MSARESASEILKWGWENRAAIRESLERLWKWIRRKEKREILVLGPGGVGKTTLAQILSGEFDFLATDTSEYRESIGIEKFSLADAHDTQIVVLPGQSHRERTLDRMLNEIAAGAFRGIIVVTSFGYQTTPVPYQRRWAVPGGRTGFLKEYLADRRRDEASLIGRLEDSIIACGSKIWLLGLATKEDLWGRHAKVADEFYDRGEYGVAWNRIVQRAAENRLFARQVRVCLTISNFVDGAGEVLQKNEAGYDHSAQVQSLRRMFECLDAMRQWESEE